MSRTPRPALRRIPVMLALLLVAFSMFTLGPANADPGNGNSNGNGGQPPGQVADPPAAADPAPAAPAAPGNSGDAAAAPAPAASAPAAAPAAKSNGNGNGKAKGAANGAGGNGAASDHATKGTAGTSGDPTRPQPISGADDNTGGANGQCPDGVYCSTRDGSPSGNGNDVGKATGKPCAGCVGKADNKNPPGQMPNAADDGNNGYECDTNNGIGVGKDGKSPGNPAHTGCTSPPTVAPCVPKPGEDASCNPVTPPCVPKPGQDKDCNPVTPPCVPTPGQDKDCNTVTTPPGNPVCVPSESNPCVTPPPSECIPAPENDFCTEILGEEEIAPPPGNNRPPTVVAGVEQIAPQGGVLPNTGASALMGGLGAAGVLLLLAGGATLVLQRKLVRR